MNESLKFDESTYETVVTILQNLKQDIDGVDEHNNSVLAAFQDNGMSAYLAEAYGYELDNLDSIAKEIYDKLELLFTGELSLEAGRQAYLETQQRLIDQNGSSSIDAGSGSGPGGGGEIPVTTPSTPSTPSDPINTTPSTPTTPENLDPTILTTPSTPQVLYGPGPTTPSTPTITTPSITTPSTPTITTPSIPSTPTTSISIPSTPTITTPSIPSTPTTPISIPSTPTITTPSITTPSTPIISTTSIPSTPSVSTPSISSPSISSPSISTPSISSPSISSPSISSPSISSPSISSPSIGSGGSTPSVGSKTGTIGVGTSKGKNKTGIGKNASSSLKGAAGKKASNIIDAIEKGAARLAKGISPRFSGEDGSGMSAAAIAGAGLAGAGVALGTGILVGKRFQTYTFTPEDWENVDEPTKDAILNDMKKAEFSDSDIETFKNSTFKIRASELNEHTKKITKANEIDETLEEQLKAVYNYSLFDDENNIVRYFTFITMIIDGKKATDDFNMYNILNPILGEEDEADFIYTGISMEEYIVDEDDDDEEVDVEETQQDSEEIQEGQSVDAVDKEWLTGIGLDNN